MGGLSASWFLRGQLRCGSRRVLHGGRERQPRAAAAAGRNCGLLTARRCRGEVPAGAAAPVAGQVEVVRGHLGAARRAVLQGVVVEHGDDELARMSKILAQM